MAVIGFIMWNRTTQAAPTSSMSSKLQSVPRAQLQGALVETARAIEKSMQVAPTTLSAHSRSFSPSESPDREQNQDSYRSVSLDSSYTHGSSGTASMDMVHSPKATLDMDINASPFDMPDQDEIGSDGTALTDAEMADFDAFLISQSTDSPSKSKDA